MIDRVGRADVLAGTTGVIQENDPEGWKLLEVPERVAANADWDGVLRAINRWLDRLVAAARTTDVAERRRAVAAWTADLEAAKIRARTVLQAPDRDAAPARRARTPETSEALAVTIGQLDSTGRFLAVEDFAAASRAVGQVALALAAYRSEKGAFPAALAALAPGYLAGVPVDPYGPRTLVYERRDAGYLLYSAGADGKPDKATGAKVGDDIVLRVGS